MDPNPKKLVLEISSDEDGVWNDHIGVLDEGDDYNWFAELFGDMSKESQVDDSEEVVVVSESENVVKKKELKCCVVDLDEDCVVLNGDPNEAVEVKDDKVTDGGGGDDDDDDDDDEIVVVGEKGQVACRDYPHSRHLCIKFPFSTTPNQSHCNQCYCYVCDSLAPCAYWGNGTAITDHCQATDKDEFWVLERKNAKYGGKSIQTVTQPPLVDLQTPAPALAQPQNQIPNPGLIHAHHPSANFQYPSIPSQYRNNLHASTNKVHQDLTSQLVLRAHLKYSLGSRVHRPVFKRTGAVRVGTTGNQNAYGSYRGNFVNVNRQQNYHFNGMLSRSSKSVGSLQPTAVKTSVQYSSQSPNHTSSTVNPQPLLQQPQVSNHSNPNIQSHVNSNPFPGTMCYQQPNLVPPLPYIRQLASVQPSYTVPAQPSYPVPSKTNVDSPVVSVSDFIRNSSQGNQAQDPIVDSGFTDLELDWSAGQGSAALECTVPTNDSSLAAASGGLADYQYDWIFDDHPIELGFTDYSSDSAFIDTGPIFNF